MTDKFVIRCDVGGCDWRGQLRHDLSNTEDKAHAHGELYEHARQAHGWPQSEVSLGWVKWEVAA